MPQANAFMITARESYTIITKAPHRSAYNFDKDQQLNAAELAVLRQKLRALKDAFFRGTRNKPLGMRQLVLKKLSEFDANLDSMNKYKNRIEAAGFVNEMALQDEEEYGKEVAQRASEFLRYWENHALPGTQV